MLVLFLSIFLAALEVHGQSNTDGFISIDCGIKSGTTYPDTITNIAYVSDDKYIDTGENYGIASNYLRISASQQYSTIRTFPNGTRNCYNLQPVTKDSKYFIRATFFYGNYDGLSSAKVSSPLEFDLYIGVNFWNRVSITNASKEYVFEIIHVATQDLTWVCLLNIGSGTPFISALELRPLKTSLYPYAFANQSNAFLFRYNYGPTKFQRIRYPDDPYDRFWDTYPNMSTAWKEITTTAPIQRYASDTFEAPFSVLQTAITPITSTNLSNFAMWENPINDPNFPGYYMVLHFTEFSNLTGNQSREFDVFCDGESWYEAYTPPYLKGGYIYAPTPMKYDHYYFTSSQLSNSTLPPIINAIEVYSAVQLLNKSTQIEDVDAIIGIKGEYKIVKNWNGDPCSPVDFIWIGLNCTYSNYDPPKVTSMDFSYFGLTGDISKSFESFPSIRYLDLSHNNLTGQIPEFLGTMQSLQVLNLTGNNFTGSVPDALIKKSKSGYLVLIVDLCFDNCGSPSQKKKISTGVIIAIAAVGSVLLIISIAIITFLILSRKRDPRPRGQIAMPVVPVFPPEQSFVAPSRDIQLPVQSEMRKFSYLELKNLTNDFSQAIGSGGFGDVYLGYLEKGIVVAVKLCSQASLKESKQFHAEAGSLALAHHRNLVSLIGYCKEDKTLALVYEYMPQGSLYDHLRGKMRNARALNWRTRLQIAIEAAQGLDYLHTGCSIIHRDVKTSNILLGEHLQAKIGDFGLAKIFDADTHTSMVSISGTPGYLDPEYHKSYKLTEKSDVYSFGVVLLELITGNPPILSSPERVPIRTSVKKRLGKGNIEDIADPKLDGEYDVNSMWKVIELAMNCTEDQSFGRPAMAEVVTQLKESLRMEEGQKSGPRRPVFESPEGTTNTSIPLDITVTFAPSAR
ncbi:hypothetical protein LUZ60_000475 [Juncus effusus]|nr:hypothetical protein LUZ60_000475 [Juncus effusus]